MRNGYAVFARVHFTSCFALQIVYDRKEARDLSDKDFLPFPATLQEIRQLDVYKAMQQGTQTELNIWADSAKSVKFKPGSVHSMIAVTDLALGTMTRALNQPPGSGAK